MFRQSTKKKYFVTWSICYNFWWFLNRLQQPFNSSRGVSVIGNAAAETSRKN